jgi:valyl-tRNA synthetase
MHLEKEYPRIPEKGLSLPDQWIRSRLSLVIDSVAEALDGYRFNDAAAAVYQFVWHELCDWYLEAVKPTLYGKKGDAEKEATLSVLWRVLRDTLVLLHPFMPFVTEEIWQKFPGTEGSIMQATYPSDNLSAKNLSHDPAAEKNMALIIEVITAIRNIRGEMNIAPSRMLSAVIQSSDDDARKVIKQQQEIIMDLARLESFSIESPGDKPKSSATTIVGDTTVCVPLEGIIDFAQEKKRLEKEIDKLGRELASVSKKLNNEDFLKKAPADIVENVKQKNRAILDKTEKIQANLDRIVSLGE